MQLLPQFTTKEETTTTMQRKKNLYNKRVWSRMPLGSIPKAPEFGVEGATPARHPDRQAQSSRTLPLPR